jgi:hypothetical protein
MEEVHMRKAVLCAVIAVTSWLPVSAEEAAPRVDVGVAVVLNLLPGFGLGSALQGDTRYARIQGAVDIVGLLWLSVALSVGQMNAFEDEWVMVAYAAPTIAAFTCSAAIGVIRAVWYDRHDRDAGQREPVSFEVAPIPAASAGHYDSGFGVRFELRYALD